MSVLMLRVSESFAFFRHYIALGDLVIIGLTGLFSPFLFTNVYSTASKLFLALFLPLSLFLWFSIDCSARRTNVQIALCFKANFTFSAVLSGLAVYLASMNFSSWSQPGFNPELIIQQWTYAGQILLFSIVIAYSVAQSREFLTRLITVLAPLVAVSAAINVWVFFAHYPPNISLLNNRLINWLGMPGYTNSTNISITYSIFLVGALAVAVENHLRRFLKFWLAAFALILLFSMLATQARGAYFGAIVGAVVVFLFFGLSRFSRAEVAKLIVAGVILASLAFAVPGIRTTLMQRGESYRPEIWRVFLGKALSKPLVGYGGLSNIDVLIPNGITIDQPHNLILSAQIRGGFFCMLGMVTMIFASIWWSFRYYATHRSVVPLALIATVATNGMFDYNLLITAPTWPWITFWLPFAICAGAEIAVRRANSTSHELDAVARDRDARTDT